MGAASTTKVLKNNAGTLTEETTLTTSAGAGDLRGAGHAAEYSLRPESRGRRVPSDGCRQIGRAHV